MMVNSVHMAPEHVSACRSRYYGIMIWWTMGFLAHHDHSHAPGRRRRRHAALAASPASLSEPATRLIIDIGSGSRRHI